jgi:tetratricopeptide (TPR) repeat protein
MGLIVAREIGNVEAEGIVLCNLGMVHDALAKLDEAERNYESALAIAREFELRRLEGQILGYAGVLSARRGKLDEARVRLDAGETLLRAVNDRVSLGILLCNRCEAEQLGGSTSAAAAALSAVEEIAAEVSAGADSELGFALTRLRRVAAAA